MEFSNSVDDSSEDWINRAAVVIIVIVFIVDRANNNLAYLISNVVKKFH